MLIKLGLIFLSVLVGCSDPGTTGSQPGSSSKSGSADALESRPYLTEVKRLYSAPAEAQKPFGLWVYPQIFTSADGKSQLEGFMRITKDDITLISVCMNLETKKYILNPLLLSKPLTALANGLYYLETSKFIENVSENNGITCRASFEAGKRQFKLNDSGKLVGTDMMTDQGVEYVRVK